MTTISQLKDSAGPIYLILIVCFTFIFWHIVKSMDRKKELQMQKNQVKKVVKVEPSTIILAFEIQNLFVKYSHQMEVMYTPIVMGQLAFFNKLWNYLTGYSPCYFPKFTRKAIRNFFKELKALPNTKIVIYTKLQPQICNKLLEELGINNCFEDRDKLFVKYYSNRSAEEVDEDTGRVIIISACKNDKEEALSNHHGLFLALDDNDNRLEDEYLTNLRLYFQKVVKNGRHDVLHEDMHQLALQMNIPLYDGDI